MPLRNTETQKHLEPVLPVVVLSSRHLRSSPYSGPFRPHLGWLEFKSSWEIWDELKEAFGNLVFESVVRRSVKLREAPALGRTIFQHAPGSTAADDYLRVTQEVLNRLQSVRAIESPRLQLVTSTSGVSHV